MTERTVTEKQVREAFIDHLLPNQIICFNHVMDELFPELPEVGELVLVWDDDQKSCGNWFHFIEIDCGVIMVTDHDGDKESWDNFRRQTAIERGEK